jgi:hypothetical protein
MLIKQSHKLMNDFERDPETEAKIALYQLFEFKDKELLIQEIQRENQHLLGFEDFRKLITLLIQRHPVPKELANPRSIQRMSQISRTLRQLLILKKLGFPIAESPDAPGKKILASDVLANFYKNSAAAHQKTYQRERDSMEFIIADYESDQIVQWLIENTELSDGDLTDQSRTLKILRSNLDSIRFL